MPNELKVFVKKNGKRGEHLVVFTSKNEMQEPNQKIFTPQNADQLAENATEYDSEKHIEDDELFYIELDENHTSMIEPYVASITSTASMATIRTEDFPKIQVLYVVHHDEAGAIHGINFQKITPGVRLYNHSLLIMGEQPQIKSYEKCISISDDIDAVYDPVRKRIYFHNFSKIRCFFDGIEEFHRIASEQEIHTFLNQSPISMVQDFKISIRNSKIIAALLDENLLNTPNYTVKLENCYNKYASSLGLNKDTDGSIIVNDNETLQKVLQLMSGRLFENEITGETTIAVQAKRLAN